MKEEAPREKCLFFLCPFGEQGFGFSFVPFCFAYRL